MSFCDTIIKFKGFRFYTQALVLLIASGSTLARKQKRGTNCCEKPSGNRKIDYPRKLFKKGIRKKLVKGKCEREMFFLIYQN